MEQIDRKQKRPEAGKKRAVAFMLVHDRKGLMTLQGKKKQGKQDEASKTSTTGTTGPTGQDMRLLGLSLSLAVCLACAGCGERPGLGPPDRDAGSGDGGRKDASSIPDAAPLTCLEDPLLQVSREEELTDAPPRVAGDAFYDAPRDRVLIVGGLRGSGDYSPDVVALDMATGASRLLGWSGAPPVGWTQAGTAMDPWGERFFVVGGMVYGNFSSRVLEIRIVGEDLVSSIRLKDLPVRARGPAAAFDLHGRRLVVFGGYDGTSGGKSHDSTWTLDPDAGSSWKLMEAAGGPAAQEDGRMVYVPTYGLLLLASAEGGWGEMTLLTMREGGVRWTEIGLRPTWIRGNRSAFFWDEGACRLIYWGGGCTSDAYSIELFGNAGSTQPIQVPFQGNSPRVFMNAALDPLRTRIVVHGGYDCNVDEFLDTVDVFSFDR